MRLIDADALIDYCLNQKTKTIDCNDKFPTVKPERKKGKWIPVMNGRGGHCCNRCNGYAPSYMNGDECLSDFCPNCGAKMELVLKMAYFIAGFIDSWRGKG